MVRKKNRGQGWKKIIKNSLYPTLSVFGNLLEMESQSWTRQNNRLAQQLVHRQFGLDDFNVKRASGGEKLKESHVLVGQLLDPPASGRINGWFNARWSWQPRNQLQRVAQHAHLGPEAALKKQIFESVSGQ